MKKSRTLRTKHQAPVGAPTLVTVQMPLPMLAAMSNVTQDFQSLCIDAGRRVLSAMMPYPWDGRGEPVRHDPMRKLRRVDSVIWEKHLRSHPEILRVLRESSTERPVVLVVDNVPISFVPMNGAPGWKATGTNRKYWTGMRQPTEVVVALPSGEPQSSFASQPQHAKRCSSTRLRSRVAGSKDEVVAVLDALEGTDEMDLVRQYLESGVQGNKKRGRCCDRADALVATLSALPYVDQRFTEVLIRLADGTSPWVEIAEVTEGTIALCE